MERYPEILYADNEGDIRILSAIYAWKMANIPALQLFGEKPTPKETEEEKMHHCRQYIDDTVKRAHCTRCGAFVRVKLKDGWDLSIPYKCANCRRREKWKEKEKEQAPWTKDFVRQAKLHESIIEEKQDRKSRDFFRTIGMVASAQGHREPDNAQANTHATQR